MRSLSENKHRECKCSEFAVRINRNQLSLALYIALFIDDLYGMGPTRVMIIDLDAHQGNGHARDFMNDGNVLLSLQRSHFVTFSILYLYHHSIIFRLLGCIHFTNI